MATTICVLDTCILIDLQHGRVLAKLAQLSQRFVITDLWQMDGLSSVSPAEVAEAGIRMLHAEPDLVARAMTLCTQHRALSVADSFSLLLAEHHRAMLVTGDQPLRSVAEDRGLIVHGVLWLLDEMVCAEAVTASDAVSALERVVTGGARLPVTAVARQIATWRRLSRNEEP